MGKVVLAFVAGLAVAALAFGLLIKEPAGRWLDRSGSMSSRERAETSAPDHEGTPREVMSNESMANTGPAESEMQDTPADQRVVNEQPPPVLPIVLPPQFDYLEEPAERLNVHHNLEREPYDPNWAPETEAQIAQFFIENPEIAQTYGHPTITCRLTRCEAAFVAYGLDPTLGLNDDEEWLKDSGLTDAEIQRVGIGNHFTSLVSEFFEIPEFEQFRSFNGAPTAQIRPEDGVTTLLWTLPDMSRADLCPFPSYNCPLPQN